MQLYHLDFSLLPFCQMCSWLKSKIAQAWPLSLFAILPQMPHWGFFFLSWYDSGVCVRVGVCVGVCVLACARAGVVCCLLSVHLKETVVSNPPVTALEIIIKKKPHALPGIVRLVWVRPAAISSQYRFYPTLPVPFTLSTPLSLLSPCLFSPLNVLVPSVSSCNTFPGCPAQSPTMFCQNCAEI